MSEKMESEYPTTWPLRCHACGDRVRVELPSDTPEGATGRARCHRGHELLFGYDGVTVLLLDQTLFDGR